MEHARHVTNGMLRREEPAGLPDLTVDSPAWFAWLDDTANRSFVYEGSAGTLTVRKEERGGASDGYWTGYRKRDGKLRKTYLGKSERVTQHRLDEAARLLAEPGTGKSPDEQARHGPPAMGPATAAGPDVLLLSKLSVPASRCTVVSRTGLSGRVEDGLGRKLTWSPRPPASGSRPC